MIFLMSYYTKAARVIVYSVFLTQTNYIYMYPVAIDYIRRDSRCCSRIDIINTMDTTTKQQLGIQNIASRESSAKKIHSLAKSIMDFELCGGDGNITQNAKRPTLHTTTYTYIQQEEAHRVKK